MQATLLSHHPSPLPGPSKPPATSSPSSRSKAKGKSPRIHSDASGHSKRKFILSPSAKKYIVHTSILMSDTHLNRLPPKTPNAEGTGQDPKLRLASAEYRSQLKVRLSQLEAEKATAEQLRTSSEMKEHGLLLGAMREGKDFTSLDAVTGLEVAKVAKDTLAAKKDVLLREIEIFHLKIRIAQDELDDLMARLADAGVQVDRMLDAQQSSYFPAYIPTTPQLVTT